MNYTDDSPILIWMILRNLPEHYLYRGIENEIPPSQYF